MTTKSVKSEVQRYTKAMHQIDPDGRGSNGSLFAVERMIQR